nr:MAG TPA: head to tail adaptor [Caudoviricetes sp.]
MVKRERLKRKIEDKKKRLDLYKEKEAYMLSKDGVQSYGVGSRNAARYNLDLAEVRKAIDELETEIEEMEDILAGVRPRKIVGVIPRDW